jgi:integrase/recombinase XerD
MEAPKSLNLEEAERLVLATGAPGPGPGPTARRDRLMILLLYNCGLRTSELCALDVSDINRERHELMVQKAKHDRPRSIPLFEALYTELLAIFLTTQDAARCFARTSKGGASPRRTWAPSPPQRQHSRVFVLASPRETMRHSFATHLMDRGMDLAIIASFMGHRSPQETGVYLHVLPQRPEAAVRTLPMGDDR